MRVTYLSFLSFAIAALCAPSAASVQQDLAGTSDSSDVTGIITHVVETVPDDVIVKRVDDACTDCSGATTMTAVTASPTSAAVGSSAPASAHAPLTSGLSDASSASSGNPSIGDLYSHTLRTFGHTLDLADAVITLVLNGEQKQSGSSADGENSTVKRSASSTANGSQYAGDTPTIRELFSHSLRICGRTLDGIDRVIVSAHNAVTATGAKPLVARDAGAGVLEPLLNGLGRVVEQLLVALSQVLQNVGELV